MKTKTVNLKTILETKKAQHNEAKTLLGSLKRAKVKVKHIKKRNCYEISGNGKFNGRFIDNDGSAFMFQVISKTNADSSWWTVDPLRFFILMANKA